MVKSSAPQYSKSMTVRLSKKLDDELRREAMRQDRPPSALARLLIAHGLKSEAVNCDQRPS